MEEADGAFENGVASGYEQAITKLFNAIDDEQAKKQCKSIEEMEKAILDTIAVYGKWLRFEESVPPAMQQCAMWIGNHLQIAPARWDGKSVICPTWAAGKGQPTHWMFLPTPPLPPFVLDKEVLQ